MSSEGHAIVSDNSNPNNVFWVELRQTDGSDATTWKCGECGRLFDVDFYDVDFYDYEEFCCGGFLGED